MNKYGLDQITEWPHKIPFRGAKESTIRSQASRLGYKVTKDNYNKVFLITKKKEDGNKAY